MKNLQYFESLIDGIDFQTIHGYLVSPRSPIDLLIHVKDRSTLSRLAEEIVRVNDLAQEKEQISLPLYQKLLEQGELKFSPRLVTPLHDRKFLVDPFEIPRNSTSYVIYLPPYYLVHTPGLFERTLIKPETSRPRVSEPQQMRPQRMKM
jgi:hypothetical protein